MKGKKLSTYAAIFIIALFGAAATMLIVDAVHSSNEAYAEPPFNPFAPDADFEKGRSAETPESVGEE